MDRPLIATCASALPATPTEWVQLLPLGTTTGVDGRGPYRIGTKAAAEAIVTASQGYGKGLPLVIDYDHATDLAAPKGGAAPAAGWVRELETRTDGVWGRVGWTATAAAQLAEGQYRYLSPSFHHDKNGQVIRLLRAGLTNNPNFDLAAVLAAQGAAAPGSFGGVPMDISKLLVTLGLPAGTSFEAALAHLTDTKAALSAIAAAIGVSPDAGPATLAAGVIATKTALAAASTVGQPDPSQYVPMAQYTALAARVHGAQTAAVDAAIASGKIIPALREWAVSLHSANPQAFDSFIADAPVVVVPGIAGTGTAGPPPSAPGTVTTLTDAEKSVASALGIDEAAYLKARGTQGVSR